jgi:two-component system OmpR family response regulator
MTLPPNILIVDDHAEIRDALKHYLERNGMKAIAVDGAKAMDRVMIERSFDLVILDVMMPGEDGLSICRRLRAKSKIPLMMLTALSEETDRIVGLELGADDYIVKPFNPREVLARIKAILRRAEPVALTLGGAHGGKRLKFANWVLDTDRRHLANTDGVSISLTSADFQLLIAFLERPRTVLSRERLLDLTSGRDAVPFDRAIDNQVSRLRRKIETDVTRPALITTIRGGGYSLVVDVEVERDSQS